MWCQGELTKGKAKVSWDNVCKPKEQGGLGIKNLQGSVWEVTAKVNSSAGWKEMLKLRDKIRKRVLWKIGDGQNINTRYDNWSSIGPLCDIVTTREIYEAGLSIETTIAELVKSCKDKWPEGWTNEYPILNQFGFPSIQDGIKDETVWVDKSGEERPFSVKNVWKDLKCDEAKCLDSVGHLFFTCVYPKNVWKELQRLLSVNMSFSWRNIVEQLQRNNRVFREEKRDEKTLVQTIKEIIQLRIVGFEVKESKAVREVEARWNVQIQRKKNRFVG
ncbi:hypothetical protein Tco_1557857 [Tanacetum coccineum]